jgi:hypothetical protein
VSQQHTPGPWKFETSGWYGYSTLWNPDTRQEVLVTSGRNDGDSPITWMGEELSDADRALIEAAPDLLAALEQLSVLVEFTEISSRDMEAHEFEAVLDFAMRDAKAAIAKATGDA